MCLLLSCQVYAYKTSYSTSSRIAANARELSLLITVYLEGDVLL